MKSWLSELRFTLCQETKKAPRLFCKNGRWVQQPEGKNTTEIISKMSKCCDVIVFLEKWQNIEYIT